MAHRRSSTYLASMDNLFEFSGLACECMTDTEHISKTEVRETLKLRSLAYRPLHYAFAPEKGLVRIAPTGAIASDRLLTELISLQDGNRAALEAFFERNGFFFPVSDHDLVPVGMSAVWAVVNRIKALVMLMSEVEKPGKDFLKILALALFLLMSEPAQIDVKAYTDAYISCDHQFYNAFHRMADIPEADGEAEAFVGNTYQIEDTIFGPRFPLSITGYNDTIADGAVPLFYKTVMYLYRNAVDAGADCRLIIDFLFHFQQDAGAIISWLPLGRLVVTGAAVVREELRPALLQMAKLVIKAEIEYNLSGVLPDYDIRVMAPSWRIIDLLTGIYFSIFFIRPGMELYRHCANPNCGRYFLIKTTSARQKYCNDDCANAAAQRNHRKRVKERSGHQ